MAELQIINDEEARRRDTHRQYFFRLCEIKQSLDDLRSPTIDDDTLRSLGVHRVEELNVDESNACDFGPRYFTALPVEYLPRIAQLLEDADHGYEWHRRCIAGTEVAQREREIDPWSACECCSPFHEACYTLDWFCHAFWFESDSPGGVQWDSVTMDGRDKLPFYQSYLEEPIPGLSRDAAFKGEFATVLADRSQPHSKCFVVDSETASGPELLRSELLNAVTVLKRHARRLEFIDHHTLPVLVITFQHDHSVRVSQMHFDGERVMVRASRQLVLSDKVGAGDMYLLARWLGSGPVGGGTRWGEVPVCVNEGDEEGNIWKRSDGAAISVKG